MTGGKQHDRFRLLDGDTGHSFMALGLLLSAPSVVREKHVSARKHTLSQLSG